MIGVGCLGVLFDLDGVLIDSNPAVDRVWSLWAAKHGFNPDEVIRKAHGRPSLTTVRDYIAEERAQAEHEDLVRQEIADIEGIVPMPGAMQLLASIPMMRWAIVTSGTYELATTRIRAAGLPTPKNLITSSDIQRGKPDPEPYIKGAGLLGFCGGRMRGGGRCGRRRAGRKSGGSAGDRSARAYGIGRDVEGGGRGLAGE